VQLTGKHQFLIGIESMLQDLKDILEIMINKRVLKNNFLSLNESIMTTLQNYIKSFQTEFQKGKEQIQVISEKFGNMEKEYDKLFTIREEIEHLILQSQKISRKLKETIEDQETEDVESATKSR